MRRGLLVILSSPSGAGKSTLARRLREWDPTIKFSVSATTRKARPGEVDGQDYSFVSVETFRQWVDRDEMLEHANVFGNYYGSPSGPVVEAIDAGQDVLFDIDWQGAQQIKNGVLRDAVLSIFILPPSIAELRNRLESRGQDQPDIIAARMLKSWDEISRWSEYEYVLINDQLDQTEERLRAIVAAERLRRSQQPGLLTHVRRLQAEFEEMR